MITDGKVIAFTLPVSWVYPSVRIKTKAKDKINCKQILFIMNISVGYLPKQFYKILIFVSILWKLKKAASFLRKYIWQRATLRSPGQYRFEILPAVFSAISLSIKTVKG